MIPFDTDIKTDRFGNPLKGKIYFYQKDTNQLDTIYTYSGEDIIEINNPVYTDTEGNLEYDVILADRIYSVKQVRYLGNYDDIKSDDRSTMWDWDDRTYYAGMTLDLEGTAKATVKGVGELKDVDTSIGKVTVVGYNNEFDCGSRTYVWDAEANDNEDFGYVLKSNNSSTGRWILVNSLAYTPSEYYGVTPRFNHEYGETPVLSKCRGFKEDYYPKDNQVCQWDLRPYPTYFNGKEYTY